MVKIVRLSADIVLFAGLLFLSGCGGPALHFSYLKNAGQTVPFADYPAVSFYTVSDLHYYDVSLGTNTREFEEYKNGDRKMLEDSADLLDRAIGVFSNRPASFVIVCGDMTKDGEEICHRRVSEKLAAVKKLGMQVFVIPGNHDINNPRAFRYLTNGTERVPCVDEAGFLKFYNDFGYAQAILKDTNSLSYVAEPVAGLWLLMLDSTIHSGNLKLSEAVTEGAFSQLTVDWIESVLNRAAGEGKAVLAVEHHGIVPHWEGQEKIHWEYVIDGYPGLEEMFAHYNVHVVFTGHYHSQDISSRFFPWGGFLFDVETGSLITYPSPVRLVTISGGRRMEITTSLITNTTRLGSGFAAYSRDFVYRSVYRIAYNTVAKYGVPSNENDLICRQVADGYVAHYAGDENPAGRKVPDWTGLGLMAGIVLDNYAYVIRGIWHDTGPPDNNIAIDIKTGKWEGLTN